MIGNGDFDDVVHNDVAGRRSCTTVVDNVDSVAATSASGIVAVVEVAVQTLLEQGFVVALVVERELGS